MGPRAVRNEAGNVQMQNPAVTERPACRPAQYSAGKIQLPKKFERGSSAGIEWLPVDQQFDANRAGRSEANVRAGGKTREAFVIGDRNGDMGIRQNGDILARSFIQSAAHPDRTIGKREQRTQRGFLLGVKSGLFQPPAAFDNGKGARIAQNSRLSPWQFSRCLTHRMLAEIDAG